MQNLSYNSFDQYIDEELPKLKIFLSQNSLEWLKNISDKDYESFFKNNWKFLLRGIYSFHFSRWIKLFPRESFLIIDGDLLITQPWVVMEKVQAFANLPILLKREHFVINNETGFYCLKSLRNEGEIICMGKNKGTTRHFNSDLTFVQSKMSEKSKKALRDFYRPYDNELKKLLSRKLEWMKVFD